MNLIQLIDNDPLFLFAAAIAEDVLHDAFDDVDDDVIVVDES